MALGIEAGLGVAPPPMRAQLEADGRLVRKRQGVGFK